MDASIIHQPHQQTLETQTMPNPIAIETTLEPEELEVLITALQTYYYIQNTSPIGDRQKADLILSAAQKLGIYFT